MNVFGMKIHVNWKPVKILKFLVMDKFIMVNSVLLVDKDVNQ